MDDQYRQYDNETQVSASWTDGVTKGFIVGVVVGASVIGIIGLSVCPRV